MYITSAARLRFDIAYYIRKLRIVQEQKIAQQYLINDLTSLMWIALAATHHLFRDKTYLQTGNTSSWWSPHFTSSYAIHVDDVNQVYMYCLPNMKISLILLPLDFYRIFTATTMDTADYWPMAWEYSIWNATIASLQFWTEDLSPVTLGIATECIYTTFFHTSTSQTLHQQSGETLFGHFIIALNAAFTQQLSLADEGYKSGSDTIDLPTPLWKTPCSPCFQHGTCLIQPSDHNTLQYTTNSS